ncbi:MAG: helix-turn-helix domain-containing protein [Rhodocyclales bacterium]|nr:helix-turn-helix domain-containing protein [Rhodocyclales bacterium]
MNTVTSPSVQPRNFLLEEDCFSLKESVTTDADDHAAGLQHWRQDYEQLSTGAFEGVLDEVWFGNVQLFRERTNQIVHQTGVAWDGSRTIAVPNAISEEGLIGGTMLSGNTVFTFGEGDDLDFRTPKSLDIVAVTVDANALKEFASTVWHLDTDGGVPRLGVFTLPPEVPARLREFLMLLLASIKSNPKVLNYQQIRKGMEQEIFNNIVLAIGDTGATTDATVARSRKAVVEKVREYVLAHREDPVTVADLCAALNVSRRTLQYSFQAVLNVNPVAYLRAIRLNGTRRALRAASGTPSASVADIAARWGFWHLSHFAADYKLMFGELPSQTLRGNRH